MIQEMFKDRERHTPAQGYAVVGVDRFELPGEQLYALETFPTLEEAEAYAAERGEDTVILFTND